MPILSTRQQFTSTPLASFIIISTDQFELDYDNGASSSSIRHVLEKIWRWKETTADCWTAEWRNVAYVGKSCREVRTAKIDPGNNPIHGDLPKSKRKQLTGRGPVLCGKNYKSWNFDAKTSTKNFWRLRNLALSLSRLLVPLHNC